MTTKPSGSPPSTTRSKSPSSRYKSVSTLQQGSRASLQIERDDATTPSRRRYRIIILQWTGFILFVVGVIIVLYYFFVMHRRVARKHPTSSCNPTCILSTTPVLPTIDFSTPLDPIFSCIMQKWEMLNGTTGQLFRHGCQVLDSRQRPIVLRGIALTGLEYDSPTLIGCDPKSVMAMVKQWNANVVRIPILMGDLPNRLAHLEWVLQNVLSYGLYVILDNHGVRGRDNESVSYWPTGKESQFMLQCMQRYKDLPILYEFYNEPSDKSCQIYVKQVNQSDVTVLDFLRQVQEQTLLYEKRPMVIIPGLNESSWLGFLHPSSSPPIPGCPTKTVALLLSAYDNIMFSWHPYVYSESFMDNLERDTLPCKFSYTTNLSRLSFMNHLEDKTYVVKYKSDHNGHEIFLTNFEKDPTSDCYHMVYPPTDAEAFEMFDFDKNVGFLIQLDLAPVILTEFGNLTNSAAIINPQFIGILFRYMKSLNTLIQGSCHFVCWAYIDDKIEYQSLLSDCHQYQPLDKQITRAPSVIPCGDDSYARQCFKHLGEFPVMPLQTSFCNNRFLYG